MSLLLDFESILYPGEQLLAFRKELYHSRGPGYIRIPRFVPQHLAAHIVKFWTETPPTPDQLDPIKYGYYPKLFGQRAMGQFTPQRDVYMNFMWTPFDEVTHSLALVVVMLRNQIEGAPLYRDLFDFKRISSYRVIISKNSEGVEVARHRDHYDEKDKKKVFATRLQATVFLSEHGKDYEGDGLIFTTNGGEDVRIGPDIPAKKGDLFLWRYNNFHAIGRTKTLPGGLGFIRIIFPPDPLANKEFSRIDNPAKSEN